MLQNRPIPPIITPYANSDLKGKMKTDMMLAPNRKIVTSRFGPILSDKYPEGSEPRPKA
jgi:hypothetical protein